MEQLFKVPIRNLYCLLSYMNEMPELINSLNDIDEDLITYDFIAKQFLAEVHQLHRSGLLKDYIVTKEETSRLSGRIIMNDSMSFIISKKPIVVCEKDEYANNILLNQVMKKTIKAICKNRYVKEETRVRSLIDLELLTGIDDVPLTRELFSRIRFNRHTNHYKRMIHLAKMLHELKLLSHKHGNWSLFTAELEENALNQIFEKFLFHFFRIEQQNYRVSSEVMKWKLEGNNSFLPIMKTDVSLTHKKEAKKIIIDAKFYKNMFQENYGKASFHSHNMYQIFTYMMHQSKDQVIRGILIYPFNGSSIQETYRWDNRTTLEVMTLNLDDSWKKIYLALMKVVEDI